MEKWSQQAQAGYFNQNPCPAGLTLVHLGNGLAEGRQSPVIVHNLRILCVPTWAASRVRAVACPCPSSHKDVTSPACRTEPLFQCHTSQSPPSSCLLSGHPNCFSVGVCFSALAARWSTPGRVYKSPCPGYALDRLSRCLGGSPRHERIVFKAP